MGRIVFLHLYICVRKLFDFKPEIPEPCSHRFRALVPTLKLSASVGFYSCPCFLFIIIFVAELVCIPFKLECVSLKI